MSHRFSWGETALIARTGEVVTIVATIESEIGLSYDICRASDGRHFHSVPEERLARRNANVVQLNTPWYGRVGAH